MTRGLGLLLGDKEQKTEIRCSVMDFQAEQGTLDEKTFFIDTTDVLISGRGDINLQDEKLNLQLKGDPKHIRIHPRARAHHCWGNVGASGNRHRHQEACRSGDGGGRTRNPAHPAGRGDRVH